MKIALYDFCDTIANFQTADEFVFFTQDFIGMKKSPKEQKELDSVEWQIRKKTILRRLKGLSQDILVESACKYYENVVRPNLYGQMIKLISEQKSQGFKIFLVSAGYSIYLDFFAKEYNLDGIISNDFKFVNEIFTGDLIREDCYEAEKVNRLNEYFSDTQIEYSISYSDSKSDLPMLTWADEGVVVSRYNKRKWVADNGLIDYVLSKYGETNFCKDKV